uniref:RING-type domain-containing protein n=1 Tax=Rhodosorus marinus TaxID=101924 RepID=A0A6T6MRB1_9RHOD|mmetsp:Transcript_23452/g.33690  ORF Transcript_23452/g.33690 Transcript_23452/m.33690 type:complete len:224 (+) Transcript_23452:634-1305(+)
MDSHFEHRWIRITGREMASFISRQSNASTTAPGPGPGPDELLVIDWTDLPLFLQAMIEFIWGLVLGIVTTLLVALLLKLAQWVADSTQESFARMRRRSLFNSFPIRTYTESSYMNGCLEVCAVCLEEIKVGEKIPVLQCGHVFHKPCLQPWLEKHSQCPLCRLNLYSLKTSNESSTSTQLLTAGVPLSPESYGALAVTQSNNTIANESTAQALSLTTNDTEIV